MTIGRRAGAVVLLPLAWFATACGHGKVDRLPDGRAYHGGYVHEVYVLARPADRIGEAATTLGNWLTPENQPGVRWLAQQHRVAGFLPGDAGLAISFYKEATHADLVFIMNGAAQRTRSGCILHAPARSPHISDDRDAWATTNFVTAHREQCVRQLR